MRDEERSVDRATVLREVLGGWGLDGLWSCPDAETLIDRLVGRPEEGA